MQDIPIIDAHHHFWDLSLKKNRWLDPNNQISFSQDNQKINIHLSKDKNNKIKLNVVDNGRGFKENETNKIFNRFYSNRPDKFGEHSGLGLNIVKNLVELHNGTISARNNKDKGANIEIIFPEANS